MRKFWIVLLCVILAVSLVVAGCGGSKQTAKEQKVVKMKMSVTTAESSPLDQGRQKMG